MKLTLVKVGGAIVESADSLRSLLDKFARIEGYKVLVHGGGRSATRIAEQLGLPQQMIAGRRVTDAETLRVVTMVYAGLVNKDIVAELQARGINALGLTGADMNVIQSHRRAPKNVRMADGSMQLVDYGFVGDIDRVNADLLADLIAKGVVPVVCPIGLAAQHQCGYDSSRGGQGACGCLRCHSRLLLRETRCATRCRR